MRASIPMQLAVKKALAELEPIPLEGFAIPGSMIKVSAPPDIVLPYFQLLNRNCSWIAVFHVLWSLSASLHVRSGPPV